MSVISIIFWGGYFLYLSYRAITVGIQNVGSFYWVMGGVAFSLSLLTYLASECIKRK